MNPLLIIIIGGVALLVIVLVVMFRQQPAGQDLIEERTGGKAARGKKKKQEDEEFGTVITSAVDRAVKDRGFAANISTVLARADLKLTVGEFIVISFLLAVAAALVFYFTGRYVLIPVGAIVGFLAPRWYAGYLQSKRLKEFNGQLSDALNLMVNSLRAGYSNMQAMEVISREMPTPISTELGRVVLELQLGVDFDTAMANLLRRMPSSDMDLVVTAMSVQREVGGNLAEVLDAISYTIRERIRIKGEIQVLTAQGRITGYVITMLPFFLGAFMYMYNPTFMAPMIEETCGWIMIGVSLLMIGFGYFVISKIVNIEV